MFSGIEKIPFISENTSFQITNTGTESVSWEVAIEDSWVSVQPLQGTLFAGEEDSINISLKLEANILPPGTHSTRLVFTNLNSGQTIQRIIALDIQALSSPLCQALDNCNLNFQTGGDLPWSVQTADTLDGSDIAISGLIDDDQQTWIETTVTGPGNLSFYWKVSSEPDFDILNFSINGDIQEQISGSTDWLKKEYQLLEGDQVLRWSYTKDRSFSEGQDAAFIDQVTWSNTQSSEDPVLDIEKADHLFDWLENQLPDMLTPRTETQFFSEGILLRHYSLYNLYVGTYHDDLYYIDADGNLLNLGPISLWIFNSKIF